jgi:hypothetical protein
MVSTIELNTCQAAELTVTRSAEASSCVIKDRVLAEARETERTRDDMTWTCVHEVIELGQSCVRGCAPNTAVGKHAELVGLLPAIELDGKRRWRKAQHAVVSCDSGHKRYACGDV